MTTYSLSTTGAPKLKPRYSHILRCLGQSLESMDLKAIEVKTYADDYIIQAWNKGTNPSMDLEKRFTAEEIKHLEIAGRAERKRCSGPSNLLSLSQVLRMAGSYVDRAWGRLIRIAWQEQSDKIQSVTIQYEPLSDNRSDRHSESQITLVEELCIHVYKQRKKIAAGSEKSAYRPGMSASNAQ